MYFSTLLAQVAIGLLSLQTTHAAPTTDLTKRCFDNGGSSSLFPSCVYPNITPGGIFRYWCSLDSTETPDSRDIASRSISTSESDFLGKRCFDTGGGIFRYWCSLDAEEPATEEAREVVRRHVEVEAREMVGKRCFDNGGTFMTIVWGIWS